ncbi:concanavalin A-like lectin/glucanase domain-containing protein [Protomyces lactucae-debilis]|uniref:Concanavalin A-like lectin/glucanase domain-containing protein n=1 Tax=Protomyces lactucae-debilis TaxID=2754530 RepID=A0A1Y2FMC4_PROLT|nr:concanavalin A-like lectin/glucanase domain-containing protein [Protomyces lactucae-debilis]ORY85120.1 concanavalin A-like lectin/glucanase domain-containing protein [Protomyces lactucae-debilis]
MRLAGIAAALLLSWDTVQADERNFIDHDTFGAAKALSDQIVLNPSMPNQMGAVWAKKTNELNSWMAEIKYRVNGPDHGGKGMAIWYTQSKQTHGGHIYGGPDNWDGLGLFLTAEPDGTGALRGHLNDGTFAFARAEAPEKHAFGACKIAHRNVGTISSIKLVYNVATFKVYHNDALCFENTHLSLPEHYYFGVSSQSGEMPDSHELFSFNVGAVPTEHAAANIKPAQSAQQGTSQSETNHIDQSGVQTALDGLRQELAQLKTQMAQVEQLRQSLSSMQSTLQRTESTVSSIQASAVGNSGTAHLETTLKDLAAQVARMNDRFALLEKDVQKQLELHQSKQSSGVYVLIAAQVAMFVLYAIYRKRREEAKSKFL